MMEQAAAVVIQIVKCSFTHALIVQETSAVTYWRLEGWTSIPEYDLGT